MISIVKMVQPKLQKPFLIMEICILKFLERNKFKFYEFVPREEEVNKSSISGFYDVDSLEETGLFVKVPRGYELIDDSEDEDFECSTSDEDESDEDVSLVDEEEA